ncbi:hypothetical protein A176_006300 [Myxococcus hansupus]|uniref:Uncharacterized protein n=1 Tax=Pseudomyxococcus hansupus TaxID=1297742 RepID=A0A0H4X657_9BACT|nr:hypothetical protein A176_006300 [Myxococcus hansupus]
MSLLGGSVTLRHVRPGRSVKARACGAWPPGPGLAGSPVRRGARRGRAEVPSAPRGVNAPGCADCCDTCAPFSGSGQESPPSARGSGPRSPPLFRWSSPSCWG